GRSQGGNNNAYCQDNEISWLNWAEMDSLQGNELIDFVVRLTGLRKRYPMLRAPNFLYGEDVPAEGVNDIEWFDERGQELSADDWNNPDGRALVMRRARRREDGHIEALTLLLNASSHTIDFRMPPPESKRTVLADSAHPDRGEFEIENHYTVAPHGAALLCWTNESDKS
ncbi:MAG: glycogen debranching enzyme GlgX, partial [Parvibaculum sp.]|nr:glycogen debranching enzyme GlgX [Parvibaculum sp.]